MDDFQAGGRVRKSTQSTALLLPGPMAPSHDTAEVGERVALPPWRNTCSGLCALCYFMSDNVSQG